MNCLQAIKKEILDKCDPLTREEEYVASKDDLVKHNMRYMVKAFKSYLHYMTYDEYLSEIFAAMYFAADRYDRDSNNRFATYARHYVSVYLWEKRYRDQSMMSLNPMAWKRINKLRKFFMEFYNEHGRQPTRKEIRKAFSEWSDDNFNQQMFYEKMTSGVSIDVKIGKEENGSESKTVGDMLKSSDINAECPQADELSVVESIEQSESLNIIKNNLRKLSKPERDLIKGIFFEGLKPRVAAKKANIKIKDIEAIKESALSKLRSFLDPIDIPALVSAA